MPKADCQKNERPWFRRPIPGQGRDAKLLEHAVHNASVGCQKRVDEVRNDDPRYEPGQQDQGLVIACKSACVDFEQQPRDRKRHDQPYADEHCVEKDRVPCCSNGGVRREQEFEVLQSDELACEETCSDLVVNESNPDARECQVLEDDDPDQCRQGHGEPDKIPSDEMEFHLTTPSGRSDVGTPEVRRGLGDLHQSGNPTRQEWHTCLYQRSTVTCRRSASPDDPDDCNDIGFALA